MDKNRKLDPGDARFLRNLDAGTIAGHRRQTCSNSRTSSNSWTAPVDVGVKHNFGNPSAPIKGVALPVLGVVSFLDHNWSDRFSSSIGYSMENIENCMR